MVCSRTPGGAALMTLPARGPATAASTAGPNRSGAAPYLRAGFEGAAAPRQPRCTYIGSAGSSPPSCEEPAFVSSDRTALTLALHRPDRLRRSPGCFSCSPISMSSPVSSTLLARPNRGPHAPRHATSLRRSARIQLAARNDVAGPPFNGPWTCGPWSGRESNPTAIRPPPTKGQRFHNRERARETLSARCCQAPQSP